MRELHRLSDYGKFPFMRYPNNIKKLQADRGLTIDQAADLVGISRGGYLKLQRGENQLTSTTLDRIAKAFGVSQSVVIGVVDRKVPVVGYASAGSDELHFDAEQEVIDEIEAPDWANDNTVAVTVRGTSLGRLLDGWTALYDDRRDPPDESMIGALCIVQIEGGWVFIKRLRKGSANGLYHLESATEGTLYDQPVAWAAKVRELRPA